MKVVLLDEELRDGGGVNTVVQLLIETSQYDYINLNATGSLRGSKSKRLVDIKYQSYFFNMLPVLFKKIILYFTFVILNRKDIVLYSHQPTSLFWGAVIKFITGVNLIYHCHGIYGDWLNSKIKKTIFKNSLKYANDIVAVSNHVKESLIEEFSIERNISVVYNGIDIESKGFDQEKRDIDFIFVGRICHEKGAIEFIEICSRYFKDKKCVMVGKIDDVNYQKMFESKLAEAPNVRYLGPVDYADVGHLLGRSSNFICCSDWGEPFGLVVIEAMRSGSLVITRPDGGIKEIIKNGKTGFFYNSLDDIESILYELSDDKIRDAIISEASNRVGFFCAKKMVKNIDSIVGK